MAVHTAFRNLLPFHNRHYQYQTIDYHNHHSQACKVFVAVLGLLGSFVAPDPVSAKNSGITVNGRGIASVEVEHYTRKLARGGHEWIPDAQPGFSGDSAMRTTGRGSITTDYVAKSPRLDYAVEFPAPGIYYVWLRAFATLKRSNSVHIGLDGQAIRRGENIHVAVAGDYVWSGGPKVPIEVATAGRHTVNLWMREAGTTVDKLVISNDPAYVPMGVGPDETRVRKPSPATRPAGSPAVTKGRAGMLAIEAEHYTSKAARGGREWIPDAQPGFSGESAMRTTGRGSITTDYVTKSPRLDYAVEFSAPGTYYVWLRAFARLKRSNSVHIGLDGQAIRRGENIHVAVAGDYVWSGGPKVPIEVATAGRHTVNLWMREAGTTVDKLVISNDPAYVPMGVGPDETRVRKPSPATRPAGSPAVTKGRAGMLAIEAEHYTGKAARGGREWVPDTQPGYSGESAMRTTGRGSITIDYVTKSPRLDYAVEFSAPGTYYVWLRAFATLNRSNSVHIGLDGRAIRRGKNIHVPVTGDYVWSGGPKVPIEVATAGRHTVNLWMREAGTVVDKLVITTDPAYTPQGVGPAYNLRNKSNPGNNAGQKGGAVAVAGSAIRNPPPEEPPPTDASGRGGDDTLLRLSWDPHPQAVKGFIVHYGDSPETATTELSVLEFDNGDIDPQAPMVTYWMASDLGLAMDARVCFRVKAYDATDVSDFSEAVCTR